MINRTLALLVAVAASASFGCTHVHIPVSVPEPARVSRHGPPPHAPAHGYRHKHRTHVGEVELVFDSGLGVYVLVGWPGHFYWDDRFYREIDGVWHSSLRLNTSWVRLSGKKVPPGLAKKSGREKHRKNRGPHPAKHGY